MADFDTVVRTRRSMRQYLPTPVPPDVMAKVLDAAQHAPSNCNTQPWKVHRDRRSMDKWSLCGIGHCS